MTNEPAIAGLPAQTADLSPVQKGWLQMASIRTQTFEEMQKQELIVQGFLTGVLQNPDLSQVQEAIREAKAAAATGKETRLAFTRLIDEKLFVPAMEFEKRNADLISKAGEHELALRKSGEVEAQKKQAYASELAALKAHITNEYYRIASEYRAALDKETSAVYMDTLKVSVPMAGIPMILQTLCAALGEIPVPGFQKFSRTLVTDTDAKAVFASVAAYKPAEDLQRAINTAGETFKMYEHDLANATAAIAAIVDTKAAAAAEEAEKLQVEQATNVLVAVAETVTVDVPKVKRELKIVVVESEQWAMAVVANFIKNWQAVNKYLRVKSWGKLSIDQMAAALAKHATETGETFNGLQLEEVCK